MSQKEFQYIHISLELTVNEDDWGSYNSPKATESIRFNLPLEMFNESNFKSMISNAISRLEKKFPLEKQAYEDEQERERLAQEAEVETEEEDGGE